MTQCFSALTEELFGPGFRSQNPHNKGIMILHKSVSAVLWRTKTKGLIGLPAASLAKKHELWVQREIPPQSNKMESKRGYPISPL